MKVLSLTVVVILGFASYGPAEAQMTWVGFPNRDPALYLHQCVLQSLGTHQVTFSDIRTTDLRYFHRYLVASLEYILSGATKIFLSPTNGNPFSINSQIDCAMVVSANDYNSFVYNGTFCIGYTYQASACNVGPRIGPNDTLPFLEIFVADSQNANSTTQYAPGISNFAWINGSDPNTLSFRFTIDGMYSDTPVTGVMIRLNNGTEIMFDDPTQFMEIDIELLSNCVGQDIDIVLMSNGEAIRTEPFERDFCNAGSIDTCNGCITPPVTTRSAADNRLSFRSLEEGCRKFDGHSVPIITSDFRRDQILSYIESDSDASPDSFWVGFSRSAGSSFSWPDGSKDLSMFGNGKNFSPRSGEDCSTAYVDVVSMELMIDSTSCAQKRSGFCVR